MESNNKTRSKHQKVSRLWKSCAWRCLGGGMWKATGWMSQMHTCYHYLSASEVVFDSLPLITELLIKSHSVTSQQHYSVALLGGCVFCVGCLVVSYYCWMISCECSLVRVRELAVGRSFSCEWFLVRVFSREWFVVRVRGINCFYPKLRQPRDVDVKIDTLLDVTCISNAYSGRITSSEEPL